MRNKGKTIIVIISYVISYHPLVGDRIETRKPKFEMRNVFLIRDHIITKKLDFGMSVA